MAEQWRAIPGYGGRYEVSDQGRVRSTDRVEEFDAMPAGTVVRTHHGSQWTKKPSGMWRVDSDPEWGPHASRDIPAYAEVVGQEGESRG